MKRTAFNVLTFIHCLLCITSPINAVHEHGTELMPPSSSTTTAANTATKALISTSNSNKPEAPLNTGLVAWLIKTDAGKKLVESAPIAGLVVGAVSGSVNECRKERNLEDKILQIERDIKEVQHLPIRCQVAHPDTPCKNVTSIFGWTGKCYVTLFYTDLVVNGKSVKFVTLDNWEEVLTVLLRELAVTQEELKQMQGVFNKFKNHCKAGTLWALIGGVAGFALRIKYGPIVPINNTSSVTP